jgi:hypothetical protein
MKQHVSFDPSSEPSHWFVLDIAIARQRAVSLMGPPASEVFGSIPRKQILESLIESLDWHSKREKMEHLTVLNACRAWRFAAEGLWDSKTGAATWARARFEDPSLIDAAIAIREGRSRSRLDPRRVGALVGKVGAHLSA